MRFYTAQDGHVVNVLPPVDISNGKTGQPFHMKRHDHASIILQVGVAAGAFTKILVNACSDAAGNNPTPIAFDLFTQETAGAEYDVLGGRTEVPVGGYAPANHSGIFYVIELQGAQLPAGKPYVELQLTNTVQSVIASAVAILSASRYASEQSETITT